MPQPRHHPSHAARQAAYRARCRQARQKEMAARGLPRLPAVPTLPGTARWSAAVSQALTLLETVRTEMEDYHADRSETWQESERGEAFTDRVQTLDDLLCELEQFAAG